MRWQVDVLKMMIHLNVIRVVEFGLDAEDFLKIRHQMWRIQVV